MQVPGADEAMTHVMTWASRPKWLERFNGVATEHLAEVCARFTLTPAGLGAALGDLRHASLMGCMFEDFVSRRFGPRRSNVIDAYLDKRAERESPPGREYLRTLRDSVMSLYEVVDLTPGSHLVLKDLVRGGAPVTVDERLGSKSAARWDRLAARVLSVGRRPCLSGAVLHFDLEPAESVLTVFREGLRAMEASATRIIDGSLRASLLTGLLAAGAKAFTGTWLTATLSAIRRPLPHLVNFDGEAIVFATVRFPVAAGHAAQAERALDRADGLDRHPQGTPQWTWRATPDADPVRSDVGAAPASVVETFNDGRPRVLGLVMLEAGEVALQTNSVERADRGTARLRAILGDLAGEPRSSTQSVAQAFDRRQGETPAPPVPAAALPGNVHGLLHPLLERHYRRTLDEPIPILGGASPRAAVRSADGREKVITWLKYLENMEERHARDAGQPAFDFAWMWRELGILDSRR